MISKADYKTWEKWHAENNLWTATMLGEDSAPNLPKIQEIADALNRLNSKGERENTYKIFSKAAVGTIKGITTSLNTYWKNPNSEFPSPAMGGSGDRISICWAVTGKCPDLVNGIESQKNDVLYHACQGMAIYPNSEASVKDNSCADVLAYHSCKGSNECKTQGGCGFVQNASGGGNCSTPILQTGKHLKSAPADNLCGSLGGCAVPISASQLFPHQEDNYYQMQLYSFGPAPDFKANKEKWPELKARDMLPPVVRYADSMPYQPGDSVYDIAWQAYCVAKGIDQKDAIKKKPQPSDIRLAMPPST